MYRLKQLLIKRCGYIHAEGGNWRFFLGGCPLTPAASKPLEQKNPS